MHRWRHIALHHHLLLSALTCYLTPVHGIKLFVLFPQDRKRSLRSSPARSKRALEAVAALSSDDEAVVTTMESSKRKQTTRKSLGRPARAVAKQQQIRPAMSPPIPAGMYGRDYHLRSKDTKQISVSSDEESSPVVTHKTRGTSSGDAGMSLSESNFCREIANVNKGSTSKKATSTPQPKSSTKQSPVVKTKLKFDSTNLRRSGRNRGPALTIEQVAEDEEHQKPQDKNLSVIAEAEEEEEQPKKERKIPIPEENNDNYPAWPPVGWKEFALAAFVTGLAAVGYVCYTTDYFKFC